MALSDSLPPWLQINPRDYLLATQSGAQAGHAIADSAQRAFEEQQRMQMQAEHLKTQLGQQAIENAMTRLAADRLENYRQQEAKNAQDRLGIEKQGLALRQGEIDSSGRREDIMQQRADEQARRNQTLEGIRQAAEDRLAEAAQARANAPVFHGGRWWKTDPEQGPMPLTPPPPQKDPLQAAFMGADAATVRAIERDAQKRDENKPGTIGSFLFHPGYQSDTDKLRATAAAMRKEMQAKYGRHVYNPDTGELTPAGGTDGE